VSESEYFLDDAIILVYAKTCQSVYEKDNFIAFTSVEQNKSVIP